MRVPLTIVSATTGDRSTAKKPRTSKTSTNDSTVQDVQAEAGVPSASTAAAANEITFQPEEGDAAASSSDEDDQTAALLKGFESPSEDEEEAPSKDLDLTTLPDPSTAVTAARSTSTNLTKKDQSFSTDPTVLYISRIPHGFFEPQMRSYFSQFGDLKHLRLARNRRTGASKHYAFLEYESAEVASIVQRTMDNYLMFKHILKVRLVPREKVHEELWKGADRRFRRVPWNRIEKTRLAKTDREGWGRRVEREEKRRVEKAEKLRGLGYQFEAPGLREVGSVPVKEVEGLDEVRAIGGVAVNREDDSAAAAAATINGDGEKAVVTVVEDKKTGKVTAEKNLKSKDGVKISKKSKKIAAA